MDITLTQEMAIRSASPVARLRAIARCCQSCEPLDPVLAQWLGAALDRFFKHETTSLEEVMGLRFGRGGLPWRRAEAMRERDAALRALSNRFYADRSPCARSREIAVRAARYAASAWLTDRERDTMPKHYAGKPQAFLWRAFRSGATMPLGERQIRNIIG